MALTLGISKKLRLSEESYVSKNEDQISKLPNAVICHILSFIPTKYAVSTSILSKRWKYLWTSVPNLDIDDQFMLYNSNPLTSSKTDYMKKIKCFIDFVDRVLLLHDGLNIPKCRLSCYGKCTSSHIFTWISVIITSKVEELILESSLYQFEPLPWSLFTCKTLVILKIRGTFVLNIPTYICFPSLKTLHLDSVIYGDNESIQRLFSSCPVLEDLTIERRYWDGVQILNVNVPSLKRLSIYSELYNQQRVARYKYETVINATNVECLSLYDYHLEDYSVNYSSSLVGVYVHGNCINKLLQKISHVKLLALSGKIMQSLNLGPNYKLPTFHNITHLELSVDYVAGWKLLPNLLECSPNLQALVLEKGLVKPIYNQKGFHEFDWTPPQCVPDCLQLRLKTVEIHRFVGTRDEVNLVKYLLYHAKVLERMSIFGYHFEADSKFQKKLEWFQGRLYFFPRGSSACKIYLTISS